MTEEEWNACTDPQKMLDFLGDNHKHHRKFRLFTAVCCRQIEPFLTSQEDLEALSIVEEFADGLTKDGELYDTGERIGNARITKRVNYVGDESAEAYACRCISLACEEYDYFQASIQVAKGTSAYANAALFAAHSIPVLEVGNSYHSTCLRDIFGNPFCPMTTAPAWLSPTVKQLAESFYTDRCFDRLPTLADALEDAGCTSLDILDHCRQPGEHCRGCWVVDLLLGKE